MTRPGQWTRGTWLAWLLIGLPVAVFSVWAIVDNDTLYFSRPCSTG